MSPKQTFLIDATVQCLLAITQALNLAKFIHDSLRASWDLYGSYVPTLFRSHLYFLLLWHCTSVFLCSYTVRQQFTCEKKNLTRVGHRRVARSIILNVVRFSRDTHFYSSSIEVFMRVSDRKHLSLVSTPSKKHD